VTDAAAWRGFPVRALALARSVDALAVLSAGADGTLRGRAQLQAWLAQRVPGQIFVRHQVSNLRFEALPDGRVRVHSYVAVYRHDASPGQPKPAPMNGPVLLGRYTDDMVLEDGHWKIHHKSVQIDFKKA
jgi:hypothetical protein